jgi:hypothetical protein
MLWYGLPLYRPDRKHTVLRFGMGCLSIDQTESTYWYWLQLYRPDWKHTVLCFGMGCFSKDQTESIKLMDYCFGLVFDISNKWPIDMDCSLYTRQKVHNKLSIDVDCFSIYTTNCYWLLFNKEIKKSKKIAYWYSLLSIEQTESTKPMDCWYMPLLYRPDWKHKSN